jgi:hypothetical protein
MPLNSKQEKLLDMVADNGDDIEADVEEKQEEAAEIFHSVLTDPEFQDEELFIKLGIEKGLTIGELAVVPLEERDVYWSDAMSSLILAGRLTAWFHTQGIDALELAQEHGRRMTVQAAKMQRKDLVEAGAAGVRKDRRKIAKDRRNGRRGKE